MRQKPALARARDAQPEGSEAGDEIALVVAVAIILPRLLTAVPRADQEKVALPLRFQLEEVCPSASLAIGEDRIFGEVSLFHSHINFSN